MSVWRRSPFGLAAILILVAGCAVNVPATPDGLGGSPTAPPSPSPSASERPFAPVTWPAAGSACAIDGYVGRLGRVEAVSARTVRFTLCAPDGAFPARLAHPSMGIIDAVAVDAVAGSPSAARSVAGAGGFKVAAWTDGGDLRLTRIGEPAAPAAASPSPPSVPSGSPGGSVPASAPAGSCSGASGAPAPHRARRRLGSGRVPGARPAPASGAPSPAAPSGSPAASTPASGAPAPASAAPASPPPPVVVLRWAKSPAERTAALREATVDGIDAPAPADAADMATLPELVVLPRTGLETAYLGFGTGKSLSQTGVRRAFAQALDRTAIARDAFPPGSAPATHATPCEVPAGCAGTPWYEFNGPAASAALDAAKFDRKVPLVLHVPDAPLPGLPDPAATAATVRDQLAENVGVTVELDVMPASELAAGVAEGTLDGLYLGGVRSSLADPSGFLEPLFGASATGTASTRAKGVRGALADAAEATAASERATAFAAANDAVRSTAAIVPLAHAGSTVAYRADVAGVAVSPLGADPVGTFVPGDRRQLVVMGEGEPAGAWCAVDPSPGRSACAPW